MLAFIGLSHLGIVYSAATAAKGFDVLGFDPSSTLCEDLAAGRLPVSEPGLPELIESHRSRLHFTSDPGRLAECDLVFFSLDVPTDSANLSDLAPLKKLIDLAAAHISSTATVVILCQVPPGFTRELAREKPNLGGALFYQVETLVFGNAVERAMKPERYMVGCADPLAPLPATYSKWLEAFGCPVLPMRYESAELAKISINFFLVSSVSTTNTLAEVCEAIGADWAEIAPALRLDKRIGPHAYLKPGLGIAGGNLERDLVTVRTLAARHGTDDGVVSAWQANSAHRCDWVLQRVRRELLDLTPSPLIAVWGLAYKQDTHSIKNSPSLKLLRALPGPSFRAHDPAAKIPADEFPNVTICASPLDALDGTDALLVMTPWKCYGDVSASEIRSRLKGRLVIDPHAVLGDPACREAGLAYHRLGC